MDSIYVIFAAAVVPVVFFMLVWVVVTAFRILVPEKPIPLDRDPRYRRHRAAARGVAVPVGVREIQEDERDRRRSHAGHPPYTYVFGGSDGFPSVWMDDLWKRRN